MSYSLTATAKKNEILEQFDKSVDQNKDQRSEESNKQLQIARSVLEQQVALAKNDEDIISFIAAGHAANGYANGKIEFGIRQSQ